MSAAALRFAARATNALAAEHGLDTVQISADVAVEGLEISFVRHPSALSILVVTAPLQCCAFLRNEQAYEPALPLRA